MVYVGGLSSLAFVVILLSVILDCLAYEPPASGYASDVAASSHGRPRRFTSTLTELSAAAKMAKDALHKAWEHVSWLKDWIRKEEKAAPVILRNWKQTMAGSGRRLVVFLMLPALICGYAKSGGFRAKDALHKAWEHVSWLKDWIRKEEKAAPVILRNWKQTMAGSGRRLVVFLMLPALICGYAKSGGFRDDDIVPDDFDDLSDAKTIQVLAGHGSRSSPFVSRGRAYLDKFQRILIDQEVPRKVEAQIMKAEAWKGISSMAKLRRLHIVRMNSRNRYLRFGKAFCRFMQKMAPILKSKMAKFNDEDRALVVQKLISVVESKPTPKTGMSQVQSTGRRRRSVNSSVKEDDEARSSTNGTLTSKQSDIEGRQISSSSFLRATRKLEALYSSLHDFVLSKCDLETDFLKLLEDFIKILYFGDYHRLLRDIENLFVS
ncbi:hypothetical protein ISCGN_023853 [Ixodes scapularis]